MAEREMSDHDLLIAIDTKLGLLMEATADQETRLRAVQEKVYTWSGMATIGGAVLGIVANKLHG